jgi:hypothetical protein
LECRTKALPWLPVARPRPGLSIDPEQSMAKAWVVGCGPELALFLFGSLHATCTPCRTPGRFTIGGEADLSARATWPCRRRALGIASMPDRSIQARLFNARWRHGLHQYHLSGRGVRQDRYQDTVRQVVLLTAQATVGIGDGTPARASKRLPGGIRYETIPPGALLG